MPSRAHTHNVIYSINLFYTRYCNNKLTGSKFCQQIRSRSALGPDRQYPIKPPVWPPALEVALNRFCGVLGRCCLLLTYSFPYYCGVCGLISCDRFWKLLMRLSTGVDTEDVDSATVLALALPAAAGDVIHR
jgi:hypothetical protein